jgi:hypothetical protein
MSIPVDFRYQNGDTIASVLGKGSHFVVSDRGLATGKTSIRIHQYCLAHLLRNIQGAADLAATSIEEAQKLGEIHTLLQKLFHDRHRYERQEISKTTYLQYSARNWALIPNPGNKFIFKQRESCR